MELDIRPIWLVFSQITLDKSLDLTIAAQLLKSMSDIVILIVSTPMQRSAK